MSPLKIVNHLGEGIARALTVHPARPQVLTVAEGRDAWNIPEGTDAVLTTASRWRGAPADMPAAFSSVGWVQCDTVGLDAYPHWLIKGRSFCNATGSNAAPVAEHAMAEIISQCRGLPEAYHCDAVSNVTVTAVEGRKLGIVGFGAIGQAIARRALAFDMTVIAMRRSVGEPAEGVSFVTDLKEMMQQCDDLVLALPLTAQTRHIINDTTLAQARPGLHLVNIARGGLIDNAALVRALEDGRLGRASLDVTDPEPLPKDHPLRLHPKIRITPHIAWKGGFTRQRLLALILRNLEARMTGAPLENCVDLARGY